MDRGSSLTRQQRDQIRRYINHHLEQGWDERQMLEWIRDGYSSWGPFKAYALAYYGAVATAEPLDLNRVRDSRS